MPNENDKYELVAFTKEEAVAVQNAIDETLKRMGAELVITNSVQVFKKVLKETGTPSPAEFLPDTNARGASDPASSQPAA